LDGEEGVRVDAASPIYLTEPQGLQDQPWFANQAARLLVDASSFDPRSLLDRLLQLELQLGRVREKRWGPRAIDLDLLLFGDAVVRESDLVLPHPRMSDRAFVLVPLLDIEPGLKLPGGVAIRSLLERLDYNLQERRIYQPG
jgi:2-amino-4-hydroxy-6-hydroxymethyldihydropteridine diphosphokinase